MADEPNTDVGPMTLTCASALVADYVVTNVTSWSYDKERVKGQRWSRDGRRESFEIVGAARVQCEDRRFD